MLTIKTFLAHLPHHPGVYQMLGEKGEVLYVGKAKDLKKRITSYFSSKEKDLKTLSLLKHIKDIDITMTHSENEAVLLECNLIKKHRPRYNVLLRDDKSYPYILITDDHPFPRIDFYRGPKKKNGRYFGPYPNSTAVRETLSLLQKLFQLRTCRDSFYEGRHRPCLHYQIGRCSGPCVGLISEKEYAQNVRHAILFLQGKSHQIIDELQVQMEKAAQALDYELAMKLRDQIARLRQIQERQYINVSEGDADIISLAIQAGAACIHLLSIRDGRLLGSRSYFPNVPANSRCEEIITAFLTQHYFNQPTRFDHIPKEIIMDMVIPERISLADALSVQAKRKVKIRIPVRGERKKWLEMATMSAKQLLAAHIFTKTNIQKRLVALQKILDLKKTPHRIECFDVSHSMGEATVASCVVFDRNGSVKSDYRRFNITDITPGDDIAAMQQALYRRFKRLQKEAVTLPEVVFIDGGKAQLSIAEKVLADFNINEILLVGISKGAERKPGFETLHIPGRPPLHLPADSLALHFIQQIRDEAHRFAITGHRNRRDKARQQSFLESIPGIGVTRRRELLRYFGGIQGITHASLDELSRVPGISRSLAGRVFAALHDATV